MTFDNLADDIWIKRNGAGGALARGSEPTLVERDASRLHTFRLADDDHLGRAKSFQPGRRCPWMRKSGTQNFSWGAFRRALPWPLPEHSKNGLKLEIGSRAGCDWSVDRVGEGKGKECRLHRFRV